MTDDNAGQLIAHVNGGTLEDPQCRCSLEDHSSKDASLPDQAAVDARLDAMTGRPIDTQQSSRKVATALQRMRDSMLLSRISALKTQLSIDGKHCGATTRQGTICTVASPAKSHDAISQPLRRLTTMTQSSEELDCTLESLIGSVHCHHHNCGPASGARVEKWIDTFPRGAEFERSPVVLVRKMKQALVTISPVCAGRARNGARCKLRIGGQRVQNCRRSIEELVKVDDYLDRAVLELLLCVLEANRYCGAHSRQPSMQNVDYWLTELSRIHQARQPGLLASGDKSSSVFVHPMHVALTLSRRTTGLQTRIEAMLKRREFINTTDALHPLPWPSDSLIGFWPPGPNTTRLLVVSDGDAQTYDDPFKRSLHDILADPLDTEDRQEGYVYAYEVEGSPGLVKIGYTRRSIAIRHAEWNYDCNRKATLLYPLEDDAVECVPNARRIEALCHAQLDEYRRRIYCSACMRQHIEWFEVAADKAIHSIRDWTLWMKTKPYRTSGKSEMVLRSKWQRILVDEQKFLTMVSSVEELSLKD